MNKKTKLILSVVGICAIVIPAVLLVTLTSKKTTEPEVSSDSRNIDVKNVEDATKKSSPVASPDPSVVASPSPTPSAAPVATSSATGGQ